MKTKRVVGITAAIGVGVLALALVVMSFVNSKRVDSITVTFVGPGNEPRDKAVLGIGKDAELPDYRLDVIHSRGELRCGTVLNRSAKDGIAFQISEDIPAAQIQELVLIEDDKIEDDTLVRAQFTGTDLTEGDYRFEAATSRSFKVGLEWFFSTPIGKAISLGITIGIVIVIVMRFV